MADWRRLGEIIGESDQEKCERLLELSNGDLNAAIMFHYEQQGAPSSAATASSSSSSSASTNNKRDYPDDDEGGVRRPDDTKRQQLLSPPSAYGGAGMRRIETYLDGGGGTSLQEARANAKRLRRWLLVNIQLPSRDAAVWNDRLIRDITQNGYVFSQHHPRSNEAMRYMSLHHIPHDALPHIGILDPRTQRLLWSNSGSLSKDILAEKLYAFCAKHHYEDQSSLPPPPPPPRPISSSHEVEDEALALALAASLEDHEKKQKEMVEIDDDDDKEGEKEEDDEVQIVESLRVTKTHGSPSSNGAGVNANGSSSRSPSKKEATTATDEEMEKEEENGLSYQKLELGSEPEAGTGVARVMIRLPEGKRLMRRFFLDDPVGILYRYIQQEVKEAGEGKSFGLSTSFPAKSLSSEMKEGKTIQETQLQNASIVLDWTD